MEDISNQLLYYADLQSMHTKRILFGENLAILDLIPKKTLIVHDSNVAYIVNSVFSHHKNILCFNGKAATNRQNIDAVKHASMGCEYILAVGSGSMNDICKIASFEVSLPYGVYITGLSVNGFLSSNASYTEYDGKKTSMHCHQVEDVFIDYNIISQAPRFLKSGIADCLATRTCHLDLFFANSVNPQKYALYNYTYGRYYDILDKAARYISGILIMDKRTIELCTLLILTSSLIMYKHGSSAPFSGGEHLISHNIELLFPDVVQNLLHGEIIFWATNKYEKMQQNDYDIDKKSREKIDALQRHPKDLGILPMPVFSMNKNDELLVISTAHKLRDRPILLHKMFGNQSL